jgi:hypothetical protein
MYLEMRGKILCLLVLGLFIIPTSSFANEKWQKIIELEGRWKFSIGDNKKWADPAYNDADWETLHVPSKWEDQGFNGFNGFAWYRKSFDGLLLKETNVPYHLFMGYIDDVDEVYFNGHLIGSSGSFPPKYHTAYNALRRYFIPSEFINYKGKNVISVRVFDAEIEGGIVSGDIGIYVNSEDRGMLVNLRGPWDFTLGQRRSSHKPSLARDEGKHPPEHATWSKMMVPGLWEHQGYNYDGTAWYKKQFFIPKSLEGADLVLILGKIDDIDQTYLNGELVGSTSLYDHLRVYYLSSDDFKAGALNLLLVYVYDYGGFGGIYEGPIGLMKQSEFTRYMRSRD